MDDQVKTTSGDGPPEVPEWVRAEVWGEFETRLRRARLWDEFQARWRGLQEEYRKRKKWPVGEARPRAMAEFPPGRTNSPREWGRTDKQGGDCGMSDPLASLARAARGKQASAVVVVTWVANNLEIPVDLIDAGDVPSPAAIAMLEWARDRLGDFFDLYAKLIPSRAQTETEFKFVDDGEDVTAALLPFSAGLSSVEKPGPAEAGLQSGAPLKDTRIECL